MLSERHISRTNLSPPSSLIRLVAASVFGTAIEFYEIFYMPPLLRSFLGGIELGELKRCLVSTLRLQHCGQAGSPCARGRDFASSPVTQLYAVKTVTIVSNAFDGLQVHYGMPSNLDKRLAT